MKKGRIVPILVALMAVLAGCSNQEESSVKHKRDSDTTESAQTSVVETTTEPAKQEQAVAEPTAEMSFQSSGASNLVNSGICCTDGERYYYSDTNTRTLYQTQNGTADVIAEQFYGYYLNLSGNTIYYADAAADNSVTAYDLSSGSRTVLCNMHVQELTLYQEKLYFTCTDGEKRTIYRMNLDGSDLESLASCEDLWYMTIYKDVIYYVNYENDQYAILSMKLDGTESRILRKYNASDLCIAEDKIFFAERDTRYLYSMNLDGSDVQQLNSTYSRCINYMNGQLYYYGSEENGRNVYSCDLNGNVTGKYTSGAKFLMLMEEELYYYDWDDVLHILPLNKKSEEENTSHGTNIVSYKQEDVLKPVRSYLASNWAGYTLDEGNITKQGNTWIILLSESGGSRQYQLTIDLTTGKITILCTTEDILPVSVYLYDTAPSVSPSAAQLSEEELDSIANNWCGEHLYEQAVVWQLAYHDYDKNGTYEAFAICGPIAGYAVGDTNGYNIFDALLFISSSGEVTELENDSQYQDQSREFFLYDGTDYVDNYMEYAGKGYYVPHYRSGISWQLMYGVKDDKPYDTGFSGHISLDNDGDLLYTPNSLFFACPECNNHVEHKHILVYDETSGELKSAVKYPSGEIVNYGDLIS